MKTTKLHFDMEFTGLHQKTTAISLGIVSDCGKSFYCEFTDYDKSQIDEWLQSNVIDRLLHTDKINRDVIYWESYNSNQDELLSNFECIGTTLVIKNRLERWLSQFERVEMISDCLAYDWVLFCNIFGHAFNIPKNIYYIPSDISTTMKDKGIDPDINREEFIGAEALNKICSILKQTPESAKHNALWDAYVIRECHRKLSNIKN